MSVFQRLPSRKAGELTSRWYARYGPRLTDKVREEFMINGLPLSAQHEVALVAAHAAAITAQDALNRALWKALIGLGVGVIVVYLAVTHHWPPLVPGGFVVLLVLAYWRSPLGGGTPGFYREFTKLEEEAEKLLESP